MTKPPGLSFLREISLLKGLPDPQLIALWPRLRERRLRAGAVLFSEGEPGEEMFFIRSGTILVAKVVNGRMEEILRRLQAGDVFGEMSVFGDEPTRTVTILAATESSLLCLDRRSLAELIAASPEDAARLFQHIIAVLMRRLIQSGQLTRDFTGFGLEAKILDAPDESPRAPRPPARLTLRHPEGSEVPRELLDALGSRTLSTKPEPTPDAPGSVTDRVHFSVTAPRSIAPGGRFLLDVWAHLDSQRQEVLRRASEVLGYQQLRVREKGPVGIARGTVLSVRVHPVDDFTLLDSEDTIYWDGEIANACFLIEVSAGAQPGPRFGTVTFYIEKLVVAKVYFALAVGPLLPTPGDVTGWMTRHRTAFASYASEDRDHVLRIVQGLQKGIPGLDVFLDVASLRSGQHWQEELRRVIPSRDVFYLFWSIAASRSAWVDAEWRCALETRGLDFIEPAPLDPPDVAPPPEELSRLHFNEWTLAYLRRAPPPRHLIP